MASNLQVNSRIDANDQVVGDAAGGRSPLGLSDHHVTVTATSTDQRPALLVDGGPVVISNPADGNVLLTLGTSRSWVFKQTGTDGATALELTAATPTNNNKNFLINTEGRVGIGTQTPKAKLDVTGGPLIINNPGDGNALLFLGTSRAWVFKQTGSDGATALELTAATASNNNKNFLINTEGRVGIGTQSPRSKLDVNGDITVEGDIVLAGADCAEDFEMADEAPLEPGTVMVIGDDGRLSPSTQAYDRRVAGILSGAGSLKPGIILGRTPTARRPRAVALSGTSYCRIDATVHPVRVGDLLTTSDRPGHAMSAQDPRRSFGAVIGKALGDLSAGVGLVRVLVALQ